METNLPFAINSNSNGWKKNIIRSFNKLSLTCFVSAFVFLMAFVPARSFGQGVTITKPSLTVSACGSFPTLSGTLGDIVISETLPTDISVFGTLILKAPANFEFTSAGSGSFTSGRNVTGVTTALTDATTITVTIDGSGIDQLDEITLSGIKIRGINSASTGDVTRTGGTSVIVGDNDTDNASHATLTSTLTAAPTADAGTNVTTCSTSGAVNITAGATASNNSGVTWTSSGTGAFANATSLTNATYNPSAADKTAGSVTLTLTASGNGSCADATSNKTLTINDAPTADAGTNVVTCSNSGAVNITAGSSASNNAGITWTSSGTGTFANATSLTTATYNPSAADKTAGSVTLTLTATGNGTCADATSNKTLTINDAPTAVAGTDLTTCSNLGAANITAGSSAGNYTTVAWTSSGTGSFANASSLTNATYNPSTADKNAGSVTLTLTATSDCGSITSTKTLTITKAPTAFAGSDFSTCSNAGAVDITSGATATNNSGILWTSSGNGTFANATSLTNATYTPSANDISAGSVTLTLTAAGNSGCGNTTSTKTLSITAAPTSNAGNNVGMCSSTASVNITSGASALNKSSIQWTSSGTGTFANGTSLTTATYTPSAADKAAGSVTLTLTAFGNTGCSDATSNKTLTITAPPTAVAGTDVTTCSNSGAVNITAGASASNNTGVSWTSSGSGTFANASSLTTATYAPSASDITAGSVTLTLTASGNSGCGNTTSIKTLTITKAPTAVAGTAVTTCSSSGAVNITAGSSATNNAGITWTSSGSGTFSNANSLTTATYNPSAADKSAGSVTLTLTATGNGTCANATSNKTLTITTAPTAVAGTDVSTCSSAGAVNITAGANASNNTGVTWTSTGTGTFANANNLTTATYNPSAADKSAGSVTLTLTATGNSGCGNATSTKTLTITAAPTAVAGTAVTTCSNSGAVNITAGSSATTNSGVLWTTSGSGTFANATSLTTATYTPSAADITGGSVTLTLTATGNSGCGNATSTKTLTITKAPTAVAGTDVATCSNSGAVNITAGSSATNNTGVTWTSSGSGSFANATSLTTATYTPSSADISAGSVIITLTATGNSPCGNATSTKTLTITAAAAGGTISPSSTTVCSGSNGGTLTLSNSTGTITWQKSTDGGNSWSATGSTSTTNNYSNLTQTTQYRAAVQSGSCGSVFSNVATVSVTQSYTPTITASPVSPVCSGTSVTLTATGLSSNGSISGGNFSSAFPVGWSGASAGNNNGNDNAIWGETNGPKNFNSKSFNSTLGSGGKFMIVTGITGNANKISILETPPFSTVGMTSVALVWNQAMNLNAGAVGKVEISTDGGSTYNPTPLVTYTGVLNLGATNKIDNQVSIDLAAYLGYTNLKVRFNYLGSSGSDWAIDDVNLSGSGGSGSQLSYSWSTGATTSPIIVTPTNNTTSQTTVTYTLTTSTAGCSSASTSTSIDIKVNPLPTLYTVTGGGSYCSGGSGVAIGLSNSQTGVNYQLFNGASAVGTAKAGTGSAISFGNQTTAGTYTVTATNASTSCTQSMTGSVNVSINPLPTAYTISGGGSYCSGGNGVVIGLANSQSGVNYQLLNGGTAVGSAVAGTGSAISFGNQITAGTYTVTATNASTSCTQNMTGTATVTVNPAPTDKTVAASSSSVCSGSSTNITVPSSANGVSYQLRNNADNSLIGSAVNGNGGTINLPTGNLSATTTFNVLATITTGGCTGQMTNTPTVTITPAPSNKTVAATSSSICTGSGTNITVASSQNGVSYQLRDNADNSLIGAAIDGNGGTINVPTGNLTGTTTFNVLATNASSCTAQMSNTPTITVNPSPTDKAVTATSSSVCIGSGTNITVASSQNGVSYQLRDNADNSLIGAAVNGDGGTINLSTGNLSATTTFNVLATSAGNCTLQMSNTPTVTVSPASVGGSLSGDATYCSTTNSGTLTLSGKTGNVTKWQSSTVSDFSSNVTDISNTNTTLTYTDLTATTYYRAVVTSGTCPSDNSSVATITVSSGNTWKGITTSWNDDNNWTCGVPASGADIIIPGTVSNMPILDINRTIGSLTWQSASSIDLNDKTLTVNGNATGAGEFKGSSTSGLVFSGSNTSTLNFDNTSDASTNVLGKLTVNSGTVTIANTSGNKLYVTGTLSLNGGTFNTSGKLTLRSTSIANTARVAPVDQSAVINGDVTVERFILAHTHKAPRLLSPSVTTTTSIRDNWMEGGLNSNIYDRDNPHDGFGTQITGNNPAANQFDPTITNDPSMFTFNNGAWVSIPNTGGTLSAGKPYLIMIRGDRSIDMTDPTDDPTPTTTILRTTGKLWTGNFSTSLNSGYTLLGNPYASPVDFKKMLADAANVNTSYWTRDAKMGRYGLYVVYNATTDINNFDGVSEVDENIQAGQGFFVRSAGSSPSIHFEESYKSAVLTSVFRNPTPVTKLSVQLRKNLNAGTEGILDGVVELFDDQYNNSIGNEDTRKITNQYENLAIDHNGSSLSIEGRPPVTAEDSIQLKMWKLVPEQKTYYIRLRASNFSSDVTAFVKDNYLHTETPVDLSSVTAVPFSIDNTVAASFAPDRFTIVFKPAKVLPITLTNIKAYQKDDGIQVDWTAETEININSYEVEKSLDGQHFYKGTGILAKGNNSTTQNYNWLDENVSTGSNFYRIKVIDKSGALKYSNVVKVNIAHVNSSISVFPNPIKGNVIQVKLTNMEKGRYAAFLYNTLGQKLYTGTLEQTARSGTFTISLGKIISKGTYTLHISKGDIIVNERVIVE